MSDDYEEFEDDLPDEMQSTDIDEEIDKFIDSEDATVEPIDTGQFMLLSYVTSDDALWTKVFPILDPEYFDAENKAVVRFVRDYVNQYKKLPNRLAIKAKTGVLLDSPDDVGEVEDFICDEVEKHCQKRAAIDFAIKISDMTEPGKRQEDLVAQIIDGARRVEQTTIHKDLGYEIHDNMKSELAVAETHDNISTGFRFIDRAFGGGITRPSFNLVSAASGDGKSVFLQNLAINYVEMGFNVVFHSLELIRPLIMKRFAAMLTNTSIDEVYRNIEEIDQRSRHLGKTQGMLWLNKASMSGTTPLDIGAHYHNLCRETDTKWDVVIVDYLDIMYPDMKDIKLDNIHLKDKYVSEGLNTFFHDNDLIGWSASQQTKGAQDEKDARQSSVSGGGTKVWTMDNLIVLKRTLDDMADGRIWGHISKGRSGGSRFKIPLTFDNKTLRMRDGSEHDFYEANPWYFKKYHENKQEGPTERVTKDRLVGGGVSQVSINSEKPAEPEVSKKDLKSGIMKRLEQKRAGGK